jgi:5-methylcytosine-specific restriction protein B
MEKLNSIFYGPAGTGKTRESIKQAVEIVKKSNDSDALNLAKYETSNYDGIISLFNNVSNLPELNITNDKLLKDIQDLSKSVDNIVKNKGYKGYLEDLENPKNDILKYRLFPLIETVTFHPSYSYQDFVEGITVETNNKNIEYTVKDGIFKKICKRAIDNPNYNYVLIIDEINRGDISSIFGELFTLLEDKKRLGENEELKINLPYSKDNKGNPEKLAVPKNLYILATMNTVDKSIALIDVALRRRFEFIECMPNYDLEDLQQKINDVNLSKLLQSINNRIAILKNEHYQIGHSYFLNITKIEELTEIFKTKIIPLLQEYFYDDWQSICAVLNQSYNNAKSDSGILISSNINKNIFNDEFEELIEFRNKKIFKVNQDFTNKDLIGIYE